MQRFVAHTVKWGCSFHVFSKKKEVNVLLMQATLCETNVTFSVKYISSKYLNCTWLLHINPLSPSFFTFLTTFKCWNSMFKMFLTWYFILMNTKSVVSKYHRFIPVCDASSELAKQNLVRWVHQIKALLLAPRGKSNLTSCFPLN